MLLVIELTMPMEPIKLVAISLGAIVGALLRYFIVLWLEPGEEGSLPIGVLVVNWVGSFLIAYMFGYMNHTAQQPSWLAPLLIVGLLGSLTTFSTFSLDILKLWQNGATFNALLYTLLSVGGGIGLAFIGFRLASWLHNAPG